MNTGWKSNALGDSIALIPGADDLLNTAQAAFDPALTALGGLAKACSLVNTFIAGTQGVNYTQVLADTIKQIKDEFIWTGGRMVTYWDHPLEDYLHYARTGTRMYEAANPDSYTYFMGNLRASISDKGDLARPITTGPLAAWVVMVAAPTFSEITDSIMTIRDLFVRDKTLQIIVDKMLLLDGRIPPTTPEVTTPPDWKAVTLQDVFPQVTRIMDFGIESAVKWFYANSYVEDLIKETSYALGRKIERTVQEVTEIIQAMQNLRSLLSLGVYDCKIVTGKGAAGLMDELGKTPAPPEFVSDMYVAGFIVEVDGPSMEPFCAMIKA